jgi:excisionase family DNA binding protein
MKADRLAIPTLFEPPTGTEEPSRGQVSPAAGNASRVAASRKCSEPSSAAPAGRMVRSSSLTAVSPTHQNGRPDRTSGTSFLPHLVDITALAEHLGVTPRHVRRLVAEGRIPFVRWGHLIRFDPDAIVIWLEQARVPGGDGA